MPTVKVTITNSATHLSRTVETNTEGNYVAPHLFELQDADQLTEEVFGPVLHLVRYPADGLPSVLRSIERSGYGIWRMAN